MKLSDKSRHRAPRKSAITKKVNTQHTYINSNGHRITSNPLNNTGFCKANPSCGGDSGTNGHLLGCKYYDENIGLQLAGNQVDTEPMELPELDNVPSGIVI